jgi:hypothetical protein
LIIVLPVLKGDTELAAGDYVAATQHYEKATRFLMARANISEPEGYYLHPYSLSSPPILVPTIEKSSPPQPPNLYAKDGALPYTTPWPYFTLGHIVSDHLPSPGWNPPLDEALASEMAKSLTPWFHFMESRFLRLRHGNALLEWADALYRTDEPSSIARAREIYKAVLWIHGQVPPISPDWPSKFNVLEQRNPAVKSQIERARLGLYQIRAGLNFYGWKDDMVPSLRYRPLKDAADGFAATAKSAQQDFLLYMGKVEDAIRDSMITGNLLKKAALQEQIAVEQTKIAQFGVTLAQKQVKDVENAIEAKKQEIEDSEGFFNEFKGFVEGMAESIDGIKELATSGSAGPVGAFGLFFYKGYTTLSDMASASNSLNGQLSVLQNVVLPLAKAQRDAKQREVTIAKLNQQIAQADGELAQSLIRFQSARFLNAELWSHLASVMKRVMQRFLDLGARFGWLAERALAYEQDRAIRIIRLNYFPQRIQGVTGADLLQLDLAELEASRLDGTKQTVPVQRTFSMAFDFPIQFAQLRRTGSCTFMTEELPFRLAYPGTYGYRIRAVSVGVGGLASLAPARGLLTNHGASRVSRANGETHLSLRSQDAFPVSEFQLAKDMAVYGLPDEALMMFEGSGIETFWTLEFPSTANPNGLDRIADLQITFDLRAHYSPELHKKHVESAPKSTRRFLLALASTFQPKSLANLQGNTSSAIFNFDMAAVGLPKHESNRKVTNLVVFLVGKNPPNVKGTLSSAKPVKKVNISLENGVAVSNGPPFSGGQSPPPPSPLNTFIGQDANQTFTLTIAKAQNQGIDFSSVKDLAFGIEYTADLTQ